VRELGLTGMRAAPGRTSANFRQLADVRSQRLRATWCSPDWRGYVSGADERLVATCRAHAAQLTLAREQPVVLDGSRSPHAFAIGADGGGWQVSTDDFEVRRAELSLAASGRSAPTARPAAPDQCARRLKDADVALLAGLFRSAALATFGAAARQRSPADASASADLEWHGPLDLAQPPEPYRDAVPGRCGAARRDPGRIRSPPDTHHLVRTSSATARAFVRRSTAAGRTFETRRGECDAR